MPAHTYLKEEDRADRRLLRTVQQPVTRHGRRHTRRRCSSAAGAVAHVTS
jgi:hypothetical protein